MGARRGVDVEYSSVKNSVLNSGEWFSHAARSNHEDVRGGTCTNCKTEEKGLAYTILLQKTRGNTSKDLGVYKRIILKLISKKQGLKLCNGFILLGIGNNGLK
jgi:hypothetical protein